MRGKLVFAVGLAVGFVLGSRAGRERYEQIVSAARQFWNSRPVQAAAAKAKEIAENGVDGVKGQIVAGTANAVASALGYEKSVTTKPAKRKPGTAPRNSAGQNSAPRKVTPQRSRPAAPPARGAESDARD